MMDRKTFLANIQQSRHEWDELLKTVAPNKMSEPILTGGYALKDIIAHIAWYENEMVTLINGRLLAGSDLWLLPHDQRNQAIYDANRERPLAELLTHAQTTYTAFLQAATTLTDAELNDAAHFKEMPPDWIPWQLIADSAYNHYHHHIPEIKAKLID
ncbi:MAG: ClbS/DfsB family four-helix bundle protein [Chloroflexi bacterium]|nr:ClbS/DfsB family four-helix bundle protein [Chloroflexota bacterium]